MAINFLNSINLNQNELIKARIENQPNNTAAGTGVEGQLYYDTTLDVLKVWANGTWVEVGGGVISISSGNVNTITIGGTAANPTIAANTAAVSNGSLNLVTGDGVYDFVTGLGYVESVSGGNSTFINTSISRTSVDPIVTASLSATGTPDNTKYLRGDNTWSPVSGIYSFEISNGTQSTTVLNNDIVEFIGTANEIEVVALAPLTYAIGLPNNVTIGGALTVSGTGQSSFGGQVTIPAVPLASTDAASKAYVDNAVTGTLVFQGGYNAATNTPNLDSPPTGTIKKGFMWTVTVDGSFFSEQVRVGDSLVANKDTPTTLADWTTIQANTDLATLTTVGLGNVNAGSGIGVAYSSGTATVTNTDKGSSQNIFKTISAAGSGNIVATTNNSTLTFVAGSGVNIQLDDSNNYVTIGADGPPISGEAITINDSQLVEHFLNTRNVIVQLFDSVTFDTVYADVSRTTVDAVTVTFASTPINPITVLIKAV